MAVDGCSLFYRSWRPHQRQDRKAGRPGNGQWPRGKTLRSAVWCEPTKTHRRAWGYCRFTEAGPWGKFKLHTLFELHTSRVGHLIKQMDFVGWSLFLVVQNRFSLVLLTPKSCLGWSFHDPCRIFAMYGILHEAVCNFYFWHPLLGGDFPMFYNGHTDT